MRLAELSVCTLLGALALGCASAPTPTATPAAGGAAANVGIAAAAWAAGGGCKLQGCPYGSYCDETSGFCEARSCAGGCPEGTVCNEGLDRCQAPAPVEPPNDFLPQDNAITNPPGTN